MSFIADVLVTGLPIYHSRPSASNTLYLNFVGFSVNNNNKWKAFSARPYNTNGAESSFSNSEKEEIASIWARVAEDYAPFDIDVTTERPSTLNPKTVAHALITNSRQTNNKLMPDFESGLWGIAYMDIFGDSAALKWSPALSMTCALVLMAYILTFV